MQFTYRVFESDGAFFVSIVLVDVPTYVVRRAQSELEKLGDFIEDDAEVIIPLHDPDDLDALLRIVTAIIKRNALDYIQFDELVKRGPQTITVK